MMPRLRHTWLVALIVLELAGAAAVLHWLFAPGATAPPHATPAPLPPITISLEAGLPPDLRTAVDLWSNAHGHLASPDSSRADLRVSWRRTSRAHAVSEWVLVPAVAFPSLRRDVSLNTLRDTWLGRGGAATLPRLVVAPDVAAALDGLWGLRASDAPLDIISPKDIVDRVWLEAGGGAYETLTIVPFHRLDPRLSLLSVDGASALDPDLARYPLVARLWAAGPQPAAESLATTLREAGLSTNRHPERLTELLVTGVTALARGVAVQIEARGDPAWPARGVADLLASADITHVSNEVSFIPGCEAQVETTAFCARPEYLDALRLAGVDIVELTGNHNLDFGPSPARYSLALYEEAGMHVFGGGQDVFAARRPLIVEHNNNRIAFLGYNAFGPHYAWAGTSSPGAAPFSVDAVVQDVAQAAQSASLVLVTLQYTETYDTTPLPAQIADFRAAAGAGADVVIGTQAHQPQAIEFYDGKPIFYGLGNLFFDQTWSAATCQSLILRLVVYDSRLLNAQLIPTTMDADCQPYIAPPSERDAILRQVFKASGW